MTPINGHLIYNNNTSSTPRTQATDYYTASYTYGQQQQYPSQAYTDMLLEETEKLYNKLAKESVDEIIGDCLFSPASSLLPLLSQPVERSHNTTKTTAANQTHMHTEELRHTQSEVDDD
jgi:hypothetical protein